MMTATEVTLKSPSVPLFQRENFLHWTLTLFGKHALSQAEGRRRGSNYLANFRAGHLQGCSKRFQRRSARRIDERRRTQLVRWSEAIEHNEDV